MVGAVWGLLGLALDALLTWGASHGERQRVQACFGDFPLALLADAVCAIFDASERLVDALELVREMSRSIACYRQSELLVGAVVVSRSRVDPAE